VRAKVPSCFALGVCGKVSALACALQPTLKLIDFLERVH